MRDTLRTSLLTLYDHGVSLLTQTVWVDSETPGTVIVDVIAGLAELHVMDLEIRSLRERLEEMLCDEADREYGRK